MRGGVGRGLLFTWLSVWKTGSRQSAEVQELRDAEGDADHHSPWIQPFLKVAPSLRLELHEPRVQPRGLTRWEPAFENSIKTALRVCRFRPVNKSCPPPPSPCCAEAPPITHISETTARAPCKRRLDLGLVI